MASSSSSSSSSKRFYDVFLSFRGADTRKTFVSFLYDELQRKSIPTFKDDAKLYKGESISDTLLQAIEGSRFAVVVVSENYAESKWCLIELAKIMECQEQGKLKGAIPIFYNVEPTNVRRHGGTFGKHMKKHEGREDSEQVKRWKEALTKLANLSGHSTESKDDSQLAKDVVRDVSRRLNRITPSDFSGLSGMNVHMKNMNELLDLKSSHEVRLVGILGMGGIGKTTLAKYVYENIKENFEVHHLLENVKETYRDEGPKSLQRELLSDNAPGALKETSDFAIPTIIKSRLGQRKVLVVVDDVDKIEQLDAVVGDTHWFGPGSRIIITTRDRHMLENRGVKHVYKVPCLGYNEALQLFCQFAFQEKLLLSNFKCLSDHAVRLAGCLPLALRVIGSFLRNKSEEDWKMELDKLKGSPHKEVEEILKISYDGLEEDAKTIFLHIATDVVVRKSDDMRIECLTSGTGGDRLIKQLDQKSLIHAGYAIRMHDLLRQMGREISCQRILVNADEIRDVLANSQGTGTIETICLRASRTEGGGDIMVDENAFKEMPNLKYFEIIFDSFNKKAIKVSLPSGVNFTAPNLRYLSWDRYPHKTLQFTATNLVYLDLRQSELEKLWDHRRPPSLLKLKKIDISRSKHLKEFPNLSNAPNVEVIMASYCTSLIEIPSSISCLSKLTWLNLEYCEQLKRLPNNMNMESLENVDIDNCASLEVFPLFSRGITRFRLFEGGTKAISKSIGYLTHLKDLLLKKFERLQSLPDSIGDLTSLRALCIESCPMLRRIPDTIQKLTSLQEIMVFDCPNITEFPHLPANLKTLVIIREKTSTFYSEDFEGSLTLGNLDQLQILPDSIGDLTSMQVLCIESCPMLRRIPETIQELTSLREISISDCPNITECPHFPKNVKKIKVIGTGIKEFPPWIGDLCYLEDLRIALNESSTICLPASIYNLKSLRHFCLEVNSNLESFVAQQIHGATSLQSPPSSNFVKLKVLEISRPKKSNGISFHCPPLSSFPLLKRLKMANLNMLEISDDLGELTHLEELDLTGNDFEEIPVSIKQLTKLGLLRIKNCKKLHSLPELPSDSMRLCAHGCTALETSLVFEEPWECFFGCKEKEEESTEDEIHEEPSDSESSGGLLIPRKKFWGITGIFERLKSKASLYFGIGLAFVAFRLLSPSPRAIAPPLPVSPSPTPLPPPPPDASSNVAPRRRRFFSFFQRPSPPPAPGSPSSL